MSLGLRVAMPIGPKIVGLKSYVLSPRTGTYPVTRNVVIFLLYFLLYFYSVQ